VPFKVIHEVLVQVQSVLAIRPAGIAHGPVVESIRNPMFDPQPLHFRPLESRANLFAD